MQIYPLLSFGALVEQAATDSDYQDLEDRMAAFITQNSSQELYLQLNADFNILRLHGSHKVASICSDILLALSNRGFAIDWSRYPDKVAHAYQAQMAVKDSPSFGIEDRVTSDDRMMFWTVAMLYDVLVAQLREEIQGS